MASPNTQSLPIPADESTDSAEVLRCLESAREAWRTGQQREAVRWLQRGAEAAEQDGNDMRALGFARAAADLSAQVGASGPPPLPDAESVATSGATGSEGRVAKTNGASAAAGSLTPPPKPVKEVSTSAPSPPSSRAAPAAPSTPSRPPGGPRVPSPPRAPSTSSSTSATSSGSFTSGTGSSPANATASPSGASTSHKEFAKVPEAAPLSASLADLLEGGLAQRVHVKRSALDEGLLVVRPAQGSGSKGPHGTRQAVLVYVESSD